jgi:hypothetical protein
LVVLGVTQWKATRTQAAMLDSWIAKERYGAHR